MSDDKKKQEKIKNYYDDSYSVEVPKYKSYKDLLNFPCGKFKIKQLLKLYPPQKNEQLLDLGCALGHISFAFAPYYKRIVGIDYSESAIKGANRLLETSPYKNIRFAQSGAENLRLPSNCFNVIISADLFEHLYREIYRSALDECRRVLKKHGKLVIWTPNRGHIIEILKNNNIFIKRDTGHVDYKKMSTLIKDLKDRNFLIKKSYYTESHLPVFSVIERTFLPWLPFLRRRIAILAEKTD